MLYNQGAGWGTHKEPGCQKHPVSNRVFLVDNVIVAKAMHSKVKYGRVSIFVISKTGQQIIPIKRAKNAEVNQNFPEKHKSKKNVLATVCAGLYYCLQAKKKKKMPVDLCLCLLFQCWISSNLVPQCKCLSQWNIRATPWQFEGRYVLLWPLLQPLANVHVELVEII